MTLDSDCFDQVTAEQGLDYVRVKALEWTAEDVGDWQLKQAEKDKRKNTGFSGYADAYAKKYEKQTDAFKPDLKAYEHQKQLAESSHTGVDRDSFYRDRDSLAFANVDSKPDEEGVARLAADVEKQYVFEIWSCRKNLVFLTIMCFLFPTARIETRKKFSRRRTFREDAEITYINEENEVFNKKISRAYDQHTKEIKASFERGTAL